MLDTFVSHTFLVSFCPIVLSLLECAGARKTLRDYFPRQFFFCQDAECGTGQRHIKTDIKQIASHSKPQPNQISLMCNLSYFQQQQQQQQVEHLSMSPPRHYPTWYCLPPSGAVHYKVLRFHFSSPVLQRRWHGQHPQFNCRHLIAFLLFVNCGKLHAARTHAFPPPSCSVRLAGISVHTTVVEVVA